MTHQLISNGALRFITEEANEIHSLCDSAFVPREINGESLSMSQRVTILTSVYLGLVKRIGAPKGPSLH
jgi:hypothetical protein